MELEPTAYTGTTISLCKVTRVGVITYKPICLKISKYTGTVIHNITTFVTPAGKPCVLAAADRVGAIREPGSTCLFKQLFSKWTRLVFYLHRGEA